jgi:hypothetical protein
LWQDADLKHQYPEPGTWVIKYQQMDGTVIEKRVHVKDRSSMVDLPRWWRSIDFIPDEVKSE